MYLDTIARTGDNGVYSNQNASYAPISFFSSNKSRKLYRYALDSVLEYLAQMPGIGEPQDPRMPPPPMPPKKRIPAIRIPPIPPGRDDEPKKRRTPIIIPNTPDGGDDGTVNKGYMIKTLMYVADEKDQPIEPTKPDYAIDKPISPVGPNKRPPLRMPRLPKEGSATKNPSNPNDDPAA